MDCSKNDKFTEIWSLVGQSSENFKGGTIWNVVTQINGALQAVGYGLLIFFFAMGVFKSAASFQELRWPAQAIRLFVRFCVAEVAITYGMDIIVTIFTICGDVVSTIAGSLGAHHMVSLMAISPTDAADLPAFLAFLLILLFPFCYSSPSFLKSKCCCPETVTE